MKIAVFGDMNSNHRVLGLLFEQTAGVDAYYCDGDVVHHNSSNGARWTDECIGLLIAHNVISVNGNHEKSLLGRLQKDPLYMQNEGYLRKDGIPRYSETTREFLLGLNDQKDIGEVLLAHESALGRLMVFPRRDEFEELRRRGKRMLFFGHSHRRMHFVWDEKFPWWMNYFERERFFPRFDVGYDVSKGLHMINPGNLEMARPPFGFYECGSYVIYDDNRKTITFKKLMGA